MKMLFHRQYSLIAGMMFILVSGMQPACSQRPALFFRHISVEDGLSNSTVHAVYQDRMGFIWFGTEFGLNKYDGYSFTVYQHNKTDSTSIASNYIVRIFEDSYGNFWIGHGVQGLDRFDREKEIFTSYTHQPGQPESLSSNNIRAIFEDSRKNLWIGTAGGGLNLFDRQSGTFIHFQDDTLDPSDIGSNHISSVAEDAYGNLWLASPEGRLIKFDANTKKGKTFILHNDPVNLYKVDYGSVYVDSENKVWFGTEKGLFLYDQEKEVFRHFKKGDTNRDLNESAVTGVLELAKGLFMVAVDHGGINIYNSKTGTFSYHLNSRLSPNSLSNNQPMTLYRSADGTIWIGNFKGGVNILNERSVKFQQYRNLVDPAELLNIDNSVLTLCEDIDGNIWIGTDGQGIDIIDPRTYKIKHLLAERNNPNSIPGNVVAEIYRDSNNDLWIGTYMAGMSKFDWKTKQFTHYRKDRDKPESICGNNVWSILEDRDGLLWIGTMGNGMDQFDRKTNTFFHYRNDPDDSESLSNNDVFKVFRDRKGQIWAGTRNGLCLMNRMTGKFTRFMSEKDSVNGIFGNWVYDIYEDHTGNLWIGTDLALNLYHSEDRTFEHFQETGGSGISAVYCITGDKNGNLWISTNKGLSRFNLASKTFRSFDVADGLQSNEFNYTSVLNGSDGKLYFGGRYGFNVFHPDSVKDNVTVPPVYLTKITVSNSPVGPRQTKSILDKHVNFAKAINLNHKHSVVTFEFAALNYTNPQKNQYAYWLEGFDDSWNFIGNKHEVTYTNLNPGRYVLKVKGSNNDGIWNETGVSLRINVYPPWWKTWWFRTFVYVALVSLLLFLYYLRISFYRNQKEKLMVLVKERTFQLEEVAVRLEEKQEEINSQNEELMAQRDELENANAILTDQKQQILDQNKELDEHRNRLEYLVEERTRELMLAKEKAEESDRLKSSFLANLSHEIRTPLNAILGFSTLLGEKGLSDAERDEYNAIIQNSSNTLLDLISDILDISKIEAGQLELDLKEVSLETVISDLIGIFELLMKREDKGLSKAVELKVAMSDEILKTQIITDKLRLEQILSNLLSNAIKFTEKGYIEIGCVKLANREMLEFYVKDTGIGIKEENQKVVFERFRKIEEDKSHLHRGTGLGLAISSQLVNLLGGTIYLDSKPGEGTVFYFTIPLIKSDSSYIPAQRGNLGDILPDFSNSTILVAEDDQSNFNYMERLLTNAGAKVIRADNGNQVLKLLKINKRIRLILMDIKMPEMDGIETLREIRKMKIEIPVIAQTAYALADEVVKLKKEGFDEYISKPIAREYLYRIVGKYLVSSDRLNG